MLACKSGVQENAHWARIYISYVKDRHDAHFNLVYTLANNSKCDIIRKQINVIKLTGKYS